MAPRFDAHTHVFAPGQIDARERICQREPAFAELYADPKAKLAAPDDLCAALEAARFDGAVAAGFAFDDPGLIAEQNDALLAAGGSGSPDIVPFVSVNPRRPGWERTLEEARAAGARGVGELRPGNQGWDPLGPEGERLAATAADLGLILLWHVSEPVGHEYPGKHGGIGPAELITLALRFPAVAMIGAHLGGGAPFYLQMPEIFDALDSLYFDTAAVSLLYHEQSVVRVAGLAGVERILFASDFPLLSPRHQAERVAASLPVDMVDQVLGGNASRLLGRHETT